MARQPPDTPAWDASREPPMGHQNARCRRQTLRLNLRREQAADSRSGPLWAGPPSTKAIVDLCPPWGGCRKTGSRRWPPLGGLKMGGSFKPLVEGGAGPRTGRGCDSHVGTSPLLFRGVLSM